MALLVITLPAVARAQAPATLAPYQEMKRRGDDLLDARRFAEALAAYDAAYAADPRPSILYNRGRALEFLARYPEALDSIRRFSREAPPDIRARVPGLAQLLAELEARVSTLTIQCDVAGARVLLSGHQIGICPFAVPISVSAGRHSFEAVAEGYLPYHRELTLPGAASASVRVLLAARDSSALLI